MQPSLCVRSRFYHPPSCTSRDGPSVDRMSNGWISSSRYYGYDKDQFLFVSETIDYSEFKWNDDRWRILVFIGVISGSSFISFIIANNGVRNYSDVPSHRGNWFIKYYTTEKPATFRCRFVYKRYFEVAGYYRENSRIRYDSAPVGEHQSDSK